MPELRASRSIGYMSSSGSGAVSTRVDNVSLMSERTNRERWQAVIESTLVRWLEDPAAIEDDGIDAPSGTILRLALDCAESLRDQGYAAPDSVIPDPNGGIVLRRKSRNGEEVLHIWDDGVAEFQQLLDGQLVSRRPF